MLLTLSDLKVIQAVNINSVIWIVCAVIA